MNKFRDWTLGAKLLTGSVVCFLLSIPLCGMGFTIDTAGTKMQQFEFGSGLLLLAVSGFLFFAGLLALIHFRFGAKPPSILRKNDDEK